MISRINFRKSQTLFVSICKIICLAKPKIYQILFAPPVAAWEIIMSTRKIESATFIITSISLLLAAVAIVLLFVLGIKGSKPIFSASGAETDTENDSGNQEDNSQSTGTVPTSVVLDETPDYGQSYIDSIIFLGDSTTAHMRSRGVLTGGTETKQVWSGENNTLNLDYNIDTTTIVYPETGEKITIGQAASLKKPEYMVITMGINNGVAYCTETQFKSYYQKLIDTILENSPGTKIMLQSIFPVSAQKEKDTPSLANSRIDAANVWVKEIAEQNNLRYLETATILKDATGALKPEYDNGDGLHLTADGYRALLEYIRTHGYK